MRLTQAKIELLARYFAIYSNDLQGYRGKAAQERALAMIEVAAGLTLTVLGSGSFRFVFACVQFPKIVIKYDNREHNECNKREWEFYTTTECKKIKRALAKCKRISSDERVLVMERVDGPLLYEKLGEDYEQEQRIVRGFAELLSSYDMHGANIMFCNNRKRFIVVDYAD